MQSGLIYLDNNATTPCDPRVVDTMLPFFYEQAGNAASRNHPLGWMAEEAVQEARGQVSDLIQVEPKEIVFTSGATESINLAIKGVFDIYQRKGRHIITLKTEHKAVLDTCASIEKQGVEVTYLDVDEEGLVSLSDLDEAIRPDTILVSIMWANNETGVIQPMKEIGQLCEKHGVLLMSDATQAVGKIEVSPKSIGIHLMAFSAHKMYGPKGVGALYVCRRQPKVKITPQILGGGHEQGMRSGTLNVPGIVGFGKAASIAKAEMESEAKRLSVLRDKLEHELSHIELSMINGSKDKRLPHVTNILFRYAEAESVMMTFNQQLALSSGSACTSASIEPSHVITAMGRSADMAHSSMRFSLGRFTTEEQVDTAIALVKRGVEHIRQSSPVWEDYKTGHEQENI
jgi:cysteine desulfurase